ncbi:hypothetical protein GGR90_003290 [Sphingopyxis italica]|uniref:Uncharacterized protein n=1 Tax=Sphingopyxis italica TaxID=1129133 RepID=A0A7X5XTL2_9SPHN|nr:hypothetical protein [Sphingopyxis italica]NJB91088.1 hypothetical protein [Sphingopyxis italica]
MNQSLDVATPETPNIARIGAADQLIYELHLTNFPACHLGWAAGMTQVRMPRFI